VNTTCARELASQPCTIRTMLTRCLPGWFSHEGGVRSRSCQGPHFAEHMSGPSKTSASQQDVDYIQANTIAFQHVGDHFVNTCQAQQDVDYIQANTIVLRFVFSSYIKSSGETDTVVVPMNISYPYPYTSTYTWESTCVTLILTLPSGGQKRKSSLSPLFFHEGLRFTWK
jgi:hypothetical protein